MYHESNVQSYMYMYYTCMNNPIVWSIDVYNYVCTCMLYCGRFPLFMKGGSERPLFQYAVHLLNKDIAQVHARTHTPFSFSTGCHNTKHSCTHNSTLEGAMQLKQVPFDFSFHFLYSGILFSILFFDSQKSNHGL